MREKNKGITLIALIITIIIMLILVGITIQVVINSNLFEIAQDAGNRTETAYQEESTLGGVTINGKEYESIDEYFNGVTPELIYKVQDNIIKIATPSYEAYIGFKSIAEKEQVFAEWGGYTDINELINIQYNGVREDYEAALIDDFRASSYEDALNLLCKTDKILYYEFFNNSGKFKDIIINKSKEEKEQAYAEFAGFNDIEALIEDWCDGNREDYEAEAIEVAGHYSNGEISTYEDALNLLLSTCEGSNDEYVNKMGGNVTITDPSGVEHVLAYSSIEESLFTYRVDDGGEYEFIAENNTGATCTIKITVDDFPSFTLVDLDGEQIGVFCFTPGDTWEDLIGVSLSEEVEIVGYPGEWDLGVLIKVQDDQSYLRNESLDEYETIEISEEIIEGTTYALYKPPA